MALFSEIKFTNIKFEVEKFLKDEYNKANVLFSAASPYGQILTVVENLHQLSLLYLKNAIGQFDLSQANSNNDAHVERRRTLSYAALSKLNALGYTNELT